MSAVITFLLQITVYSAILCAAIILIKKIFRAYLSPALHYALWWLLILRLLIPVTVDSGVHLLVLPSAPTVVSETAGNTFPIGSNASSSSLADITTQPDVSTAAPLTGADKSIPFAATQINWQAALVLIWAVGVLASLAYRTALWWRLYRKIDKSALPVPSCLTDMVEKCKKELGIHADIGISLQSFLNSPALSSTLKPKLLLPDNMLNNMDGCQIEFGIRHELTHYKRRDYLANLLLIILRCVYWFNPVVWVAFPQIEADMEAACDAAVTGGMGMGEKTRYVETLINFGSNRNLHYMLDMGTHLGRKAMEKRIRSIFMTKKTRFPVILAMLLLTIILLFSCFTTACNPTHGTSASSSSQGSSTSSSSPTSNALDNAVSSAILSRLSSDPFGEKKAEGHVTLGTQKDKNGETLVYVVASYAAFGFENNVFTIVSGSGATPAVIRLSGNGSDYKLISYTEIEDGDRNQSSIQSMFPEQYWASAKNVGQYLSELQKQQVAQASAYLKSIGRDAQIQLSGVARKSFNISAKASNTLIAINELSDYPSWIGTREKVVGGTRTVYKAGEQDLTGYSLITYTKESAGGNILQQMQFKVTGDRVVQQPINSTVSPASAKNMVTGTVTDATMSTITILATDGNTYTLIKDSATVKSDHGILIGDTAEIEYNGVLKNGSARALIITIKNTAHK